MAQQPEESTTTTHACAVFNPKRLSLDRRAEFLPLRIFAKERVLKVNPEWEQWTPEEERGRRVTAQFSPVPAQEILASLTARAARPGMTILVGFAGVVGGGLGALAAIGETSRNLQEFIETAGPQTAAGGRDFLVLDDCALLRVLRRGLSGFTVAVRVEPGEHDRIEVSDLESIIRAVGSKRSPLEADLRTIAWLRFGPDASVEVTARRRSVVHELVAEGMALYLAAQLGVPHRDVARPESWRIAQLLGISGHLELHPRETLVTSTFADVGCCCSAPSERHPAAIGMIYDLPSRTWHGEEG